MILFLDLTTGFFGCGMAVIYLYFIAVIRKHSAAINIDTDNLFVLNFFMVYKSYLRVRKSLGLKPGLLFYLHFLFLIVSICLAYYMAEHGLGARIQ